MDFQMLLSDVTQLIGSYLLEDKNKTIHKIFHDKKDDDLQVLLFGEVKDLKYIDIDNVDNEIPYVNDHVKDYINVVFQTNKLKERCTKMTVNFYQRYGPIKITIHGYNANDVRIAQIYHYQSHDTGKKYYTMDYLCRGFLWCDQNVKKKSIIREYKTISKDIINKYF